MTLDVTTIRSLLAFEDPGGVLSLYAEHVPEQAGSSQVGRLEIRNRVRDLVAGMAQDEAKAVRARLEEAAADVEWLTDPTVTGRGRALFLGVQDGRTERINLQLPFRHRVVHRETGGLVRPLVAAVDEGRPALVVLVDAKAVQTLRWEFGALEHVETREFEIGDAQTADEFRGPSARPDQRGVSHNERFEERIDANRGRFLKSVGEDVRDRLASEGIDRVLLCGPARVRNEVQAVLPDRDGVTVVTTDQHLGDVGDARLMDVCWERLRSAHREREAELVAAARDRAGAGGAGVIGVAGTLAALNEGRVEHLLFADDVNVSGFVADDGMLHLTPGSERRREPTDLLVEHMVERALSTSAKVTPVDDDVAEELGDDGGVAALLRW